VEPLKRRKRKGPEAGVVTDIRATLHMHGWYTIKTHGSEYQSGLPDLYCCHSRYGTRWVEAKFIESYKFTPAQLDVFPKLCANGAGVWVLVNGTDYEYKKLFGPCNWYTYLSVMKT